MHRSEFRKTIGEEARKQQMEVTQAKLKECINKGSMNSFERLSAMLDTSISQENDDEMETDAAAVPLPAAMDEPSSKGENKVPVKKSRRLKHKLKKGKVVEKKPGEGKERRKPKYWCSF
jgi:hypothetical protein